MAVPPRASGGSLICGPSLARAMRSLAVAAVLAAVLLAPLAPVARASDWEDGGRTLDVDARTDGFEIRSERSSGEGHDEIRLRLEGDAVRFRFELRREAAAVDADAELRLELERVLEFRDENGDGAFQDGENVRAEHTPSDLTLLSVDAENVSAAGVPGIAVTATYRFDRAPASGMTFRATAFGDLTAFQGIVLHPVEVKADILFADFPYTEADTRPGIAFRVRVASTSPPNVTADGVSFDVGDLAGTFRWKDTATADGNETRVGATVSPGSGGAGEQDLGVVFAYARAAEIVHDPTFGFLQTVAEAVGRVLGNPLFYAIGGAVAVAVFAGPAAVRRGRKAKRA